MDQRTCISAMNKCLLNEFVFLRSQKKVNFGYEFRSVIKFFHFCVLFVDVVELLNFFVSETQIPFIPKYSKSFMLQNHIGSRSVKVVFFQDKFEKIFGGFCQGIADNDGSRD